MNLPNKITLSRIAIVPIFMLFVVPLPKELTESTLLAFIAPQIRALRVFIEVYGNYIAAIIFIIASSTDGVDGYIARKRKQITKLGKLLDPIADKLLVTAALVALVDRNELTSWAAMIIIGRDLIVTGLRLVAAGEGQVISASIWGKIKTITQMVAIVAILLDNFPIRYITSINFAAYAMLIALAATIYSGIDYFVRNIHVLDFKNNNF